MQEAPEISFMKIVLWFCGGWLLSGLLIKALYAYRLGGVW